MVINVEYNQLDPLLRATGYPDGDVNSETGYSPFPGNINQVISYGNVSCTHFISQRIYSKINNSCLKFFYFIFISAVGL